MTEILMAILMIAIGTASLIFCGGVEVFLFSLTAGIYFIIDILSEVEHGKTHHRH